MTAQLRMRYLAVFLDIECASNNISLDVLCSGVACRGTNRVDGQLPLLGANFGGN